MASVLLVSFAGYPATLSSLFPDNGLGSLAGTLLAAGHEVEILDYNTVATAHRLTSPQRTARLAALLPCLGQSLDPEMLEALREISEDLERDILALSDDLAEQIAEEVARRRCHFVGFKLWSGDGFDASVHIGQHLRRRFPTLRIVGGGPAVLFSEHSVFSVPGVFDAVVDGEGERAILGLAAWAEGRGVLSDVPNLLLPDGGRARHELVADLDVLPAPTYDPEVYPSLGGDEQLKLFVVDESRGCPRRCAFCVHRGASGDRWRLRSAARVLGETERLRRAHGSRAVRFGGSSTPIRLLGQLANSGGLRVSYSAFAHPGDLQWADLEQLAASGCRALFFGVESFSEADSAVLGKHVDGASALAMLRACQSAGITPVVSLIVPLPGQSVESRDRNFGAVLELCAAGAASVVTQFPGLVPRTRWWTERERFGFSLLVPEEDYRRQLVRYKIRHLLPPTMWQPLPYSIDGLDFGAYARVTADFQRELARQGVPVNVSDEVVLLSGLLQEPLGPFKESLQRMFYTLDAAAIRALVVRANAALKT